MAQDYEHEPVMGDEVVQAMSEAPPGVVVDATVGGGGHAAAILDANAHLQDHRHRQGPRRSDGRTRRGSHPYGRRATVHQARFDRLVEVAESEGVR